MEEKIEDILIPANVVYNKKISMFAKVLYGVITSICKRNGFCKNTNAQLAELLGVQKCIVSRWVKKFSDKEFSDPKFLKVSYRGKHKYIRFIFLPNTDKNTIKKIVQTYYSIVPTYNTIVPVCKNSIKSIEHQNNVLNNTTSLNDDYFDFDEEDIKEWFKKI